MFKNIEYCGGSELHESLFYGKAKQMESDEKYVAVGWYCFKVKSKNDKPDYYLLRFLTENGEVYTTFENQTIDMFAVASELDKKKVVFRSPDMG